MNCECQNIKLSICIPTYNYGAYLRENLNVLVQEKYFNLCEVVIGDGGSSDETRVVVEEFQRTYKNINYVNFEIRSGIDTDLSKTANLCNGEYIWFLSADDVPVRNCISKILYAIEQRPTCILYDRIICDYYLNVMKKVHWSRHVVARMVDFNDQKDLVGYLSNLNSIGGIFSFMSVIVVKRDVWVCESSSTRIVAKNYQHVVRLFKILTKPDRRLFVPAEHLVFFRGDNDSFAADGDFNRLMIDLRGYHRIAKDIEDKEVLYALTKVMRGEQKWYFLPKFLVRTSKRQKRLVVGYLSKFGYPWFIIQVALAAAQFSWLIMVLRKVRRVLLRGLRS